MLIRPEGIKRLLPGAVGDPASCRSSSATSSSMPTGPCRPRRRRAGDSSRGRGGPSHIDAAAREAARGRPVRRPGGRVNRIAPAGLGRPVAWGGPGRTRAWAAPAWTSPAGAGSSGPRLGSAGDGSAAGFPGESIAGAAPRPRRALTRLRALGSPQVVSPDAPQAKVARAAAQRLRNPRSSRRACQSRPLFPARSPPAHPASSPRAPAPSGGDRRRRGPTPEVPATATPITGEFAAADAAARPHRRAGRLRSSSSSACPTAWWSTRRAGRSRSTRSTTARRTTRSTRPSSAQLATGTSGDPNRRHDALPDPPRRRADLPPGVPGVRRRSDVRPRLALHVAARRRRLAHRRAATDASSWRIPMLPASRRPQREIAFSFDSFLDVVANVVGIILRLILVAWVGGTDLQGDGRHARPPPSRPWPSPPPRPSRPTTARRCWPAGRRSWARQQGRRRQDRPGAIRSCRSPASSASTSKALSAKCQGRCRSWPGPPARRRPGAGEGGAGRRPDARSELRERAAGCWPRRGELQEAAPDAQGVPLPDAGQRHARRRTR